MLHRLNQFICCDCIEGMRSLPDACIPLTVTSPPYDKVRTFEGNVNAFDFEAIADEMWRNTMTGGVACWHVQEQIVNGSESGTSSMQRLHFQKIGFRLHQTITIETVTGFRSSRVRYGAPLQYVFVLSKGMPRTIHLIKDVPNKRAGEVARFRMRNPDGTKGYQQTVIIGQYRARGPVWRYHTGKGHTTCDDIDHPALMPEKLARDLIYSWSNPGDLVFDPMAGCGTTLKMAMLQRRHYLGFEICPKYVEIGKRRLETHRRKLLGDD